MSKYYVQGGYYYTPTEKYKIIYKNEEWIIVQLNSYIISAEVGHYCKDQDGPIFVYVDTCECGAKLPSRLETYLRLLV